MEANKEVNSEVTTNVWQAIGGLRILAPSNGSTRGQDMARERKARGLTDTRKAGFPRAGVINDGGSRRLIKFRSQTYFTYE